MFQHTDQIPAVRCNRTTYHSTESLRGFYTAGIVDSTCQYDDALDAFRTDVYEMGEQLSRVHYRMLMTDAFLDHERARIRPYVEAIAEFDTGVVLVCLAQNAPHRVMDDTNRKVIEENVIQARTLLKRTGHEYIKNASEKGYSIRKLSDVERYVTTASTAQLMQVLYEPFMWDEQYIQTVLRKDQNEIYVACLGHTIVSTGMAIREHLRVGTTSFDMVEISWAGTLPSEEGKGLYGAVSSQIILDQKHRTKFMYSECKGKSKIINIAIQQGRKDAILTGQQRRFPGTGILVQDVPIHRKGESIEKYSDLVLMSMTTKEIDAFE